MPSSGSPPRRVLIVEDEEDLALLLAFNLKAAGFEPITARTGRQALTALEASPPPELVILDLMLPDLPGTEVCRRMRAEPRTHAIPVLMLTAKAEEIDRVVGFEVGADDYVTKPFSVRELLARVRAVLRRHEADPARGAGAGAGKGADDTPEQFGRLRIDRGAHRAWVDDAEVTLTALELRLLTHLLARRGRVQSREQLLEDVWGYSPELTTRTVDTHVKRLREKLGAAAVYIETVRGVGYRFAETATP